MRLKKKHSIMLLNIKYQKIWQLFLAPFTFSYFIIIQIRNKFYDLNILKKKSLKTPIISIGNLTTGGTTKTPFTIFISKYFIKNNIKVGILSRGYGRKSKGTIVVSNGNKILSTPKYAGDEPYLMAKILENVPIIVDNNRLRGGKYLISKYNPDIILLDDGYQHRSLKRDLNILLVNSFDKKCDHKLIPNGKLREPWKNYKRADLIIRTKSNLNIQNNYIIKKIKKTNKKTFISKSHITISKKFTKKNLITTNLSKKNVLLITAIADPKSFYKAIKITKCNIIKKLNFRDHYKYDQKIWDKIEQSIKNLNIDFILTTEKDWIKIEQITTITPIIIFKLDITINKEEYFYKILQTIIK